MDTQNLSQSNLDDDPRIELAVERTELALERTHLSWIRTVITIITSGFVIDKLVEWLRHARVVSGQAVIKQAHFVALLMTVSGIILLVVESLYYAKRQKQLAAKRNKSVSWIRGGIILSILIFVIALLLIYLVLVSENADLES